MSEHFVNLAIYDEADRAQDAFGKLVVLQDATERIGRRLEVDAKALGEALGQAERG